jgi:polysaccharide chain length determinant protein (PEP-CTERM system associated)
VKAYADEQLELVRRYVLTTENLEKLTAELDPYPDLPNLDAHDKARLISENTTTERVDPVTLQQVPESNAFTIDYYNPRADLAMQVTQRLADMFLSFNRETRTAQATATAEFLKAQSKEVRETITELESRLAEFKTKYGDALPQTQERNLSALDRVSRELDTVQQQLLLANERKRTLEVQLNQINPNLFDPAGDWRLELTNLRAELAAAQQRYSPDHPDVRRLRRAIEALGTRVEETRQPQKAPDNPEYIQIAGQLSTVTREVAALEATAARARQQISDYEHSLKIAPEVEREYSQLNRDYTVAQERFQNIEKSLAEAALGQVLESQARGDRLTLIRPAYLPKNPDSPNRIGIILLGIVLGAGLAGGIAALLESSDPTVRSARDLSELTDIKPLATIPVMLNRADRKKRMLAWGAASVVAAIAIAFVASVVVEATV